MRETIDMALGGSSLNVLNRMRLACTPLDENGKILQLQSEKSCVPHSYHSMRILNKLIVFSWTGWLAGYE